VPKHGKKKNEQDKDRESDNALALHVTVQVTGRIVISDS
jgi:hypothetical protein